jgi:hypothetical protein
MRRIVIDQSNATIGIKFVKDLVVGVISGSTNTKAEENDSDKQPNQSIAVGFSENVYVNGKRIS